MKKKAFFLSFKILPLFLLTLLILSFLLLSGCSPISNLFFGASGSIEVSTYPSGAKIFLNDNDTGYITPYTIPKLPKGTYEVKVVLGEISYTETVIVYADNTSSVYKDLLPRLNKIVVQPTSMSLEVGKSQNVDSIVAYYVDSGSVNLALSDCSYSSSSSQATVNSIGTITGVSEGSATITVSYTDLEITKTATIDITVSPFVPPPVVTPIVYRAFCVGVGNYENYPDAYGNIDLLSPQYNVDRMIDVFNHCKFGTDDVVFSTPVSLKDLNATKTAIISGIASTFSGADDNDISYFYFNGHGINYEGISYLLPTEIMYTSPFSACISTNELESALSAIPGTKVVILDSCFSGGFIGKGKEKITISKEEIASFNDEIINIFSQAQSKGLLTTNQYKVLTSCHFYQSCFETSPHLYDNNPFGLFTAAFCDGCGYGDVAETLWADEDSNYKISLDEMYNYILDLIPFMELYYSIDNRQDVQVYPEDSNFTIIEH
jgi:hypothetical protein